MSATVSLPLLSSVRIASPCSMRWEDMQGDDRSRFCSECKLNVHNISDMTETEAEAFLAAVVPGERVCGRFYRRADGTILTRDCPVGLRAARAKAARAAARLVGALGVVLSAGVLWARGYSRPWERARLRDAQPFAAICEWLSKPLPVPAPPVRGQILMGAICVRPLPAPPPANPPSNPTPLTDR